MNNHWSEVRLQLDQVVAAEQTHCQQHRPAAPLARRWDVSTLRLGRNRGLAVLLILALALGLIQLAHAQSVTPGYVQAWGLDHVGQTDVPADLSDVIAVAASQVHSLALKSDGTVVAWGSNVSGQLNVPASAMSGVIAIAAGGDHSMALKSDGTVVAWGSNETNQLDIPPGLSNVIAIAAGDFHSLALKSNGEVVTWGCGGGYDYGQCTVPATALSGVTAIGAGAAHSLALKGGGVIAWGINLQGQIAVPASATSGVVAIAAAGGSNHSLALKSNGAIVGWGRNTDGQTDVPAGLSGVVAIATGFNHSMALKSDGTLATWGNNSYGQTDVPAGLTGIVGMAGGWHTLVIVPPPSVTINQAAGQADPTSTTPILFTATFSKPVTDFTAADVSLSGTAGLANATITISGGPSVYTLSVDGVNSSGTVLATIAANGATDAIGYGNRASTSSDNSVTLNLNTSPPVITPNVVGTLGNNGWYVSDVSVSWSVVDNESPVTSQSGCGPQTVTSDTSGVTFTCSATSAGGSSSQSVTIKRDVTAPTITFANRTAANSNGWNNNNVTVNWSCNDATAGVVSASVSQTVSSEGANQSATGACTDNAGNSAPNTQNGINIDKTAPTISAAATTSPNAASWYSGDVIIDFTCADGLSGVTSCPADQSLSSEGAAVTSTAQTITDLAGNSSAPSNVVTVKIDKTAPTISAAATTSPNAAGWYNSNVTIRFTCSDALAGVASCPADQVLSSDGTAVASTAQTVSDRAGNSSAASNVITVKIDKTAPVVTVTGVTSGATYPAGGVPTAGCTTDDALSGVATQANTILVSGGNAVGTGLFLVTCRGATDNAGNPGGASVNYLIPVTPNIVVGWGNTGAPANLGSVIAVDSGANHSLALKTDGTVVAWGANNAGQSTVPTGLSNVIAIAAGIQHSLALKSDGTVVAWGWNSAGQSTVPAGLSGVIAIAAGWQNSMAVKSDGTVVGWGLNNYSQSTAPAGLSDVIAVGTGYENSAALKSDGTVVSWGRIGSNGLPVVPPAGLANVIAIATGDGHHLALKSNGTVVAWGANNNGQSNVPSGLDNVVAIAAGGDVSLALKNNGTVVAWGSNYQGEKNVPGGLDHVIAISAGSFNAQAVKEVIPVTVNQAAGQADPTNSNPVNFDVLFSEPVTGFSASDVTLSGTANRTGATITISGGPAAYTISVGGLAGNGTVIATLAANVVTSANGKTNLASTSTDNIVTANFDTTPPVITPNVVGTLGNNGWYTSNVNVTWSVVDNESAISSQSGCTTVTINADTTGNTITCTATTDGGSNSQSVTIKRDATAPTITLVDRTAANSNGWNNGDVTVNWSCTDATAGVVAAGANQTVSGEGADQTATGACTDNAGNSASATQSGIKIDKTAPTISAAATTNPNPAGWYNNDVAVHFTCNDGLSGVTNCPTDQVLSSEGAAVTSTAQTITDLAGNSSAASNVVTVKIDKTAPTISAAATTQANASGWYKSDVTVHFTCADVLAGLAPNACPADQVLSSEGAAVASTAQTITDLAGNLSAPSNIVTVQLDKTALVVTVTGVSNGASYPLGSVPAAGCSTTDALSGVATQATLSVTGGNPDGTGSFTATCSGATDNAGNSGSASVTYNVAYNWTGFFQPVDNLPTVNTVNAGQAIPVKFSLGGNYGLNIFATGYPASQNVSCGSGGGGSTSPIEETVTAGNSSLQYDPGTQRYIYVWKTDKAWAGTCRQLIVKLIDGTEHIARFQFNGKGRSAGESDTESGEAMVQRVFLPLVNQ